MVLRLLNYFMNNKLQLYKEVTHQHYYDKVLEGRWYCQCGHSTEFHEEVYPSPPVSSAEDRLGLLFGGQFKVRLDTELIGITEEIRDWWLSHRKAEYTSLIEEVGKMRLYAETEISSTTLGNIQNTLLRQHVESHNQALDEVIKLIQEKL